LAHSVFDDCSAQIIFGLNALNGRVPMPDGSLGGPWDYTNADSFIRYTVEKGYDMYGWELGMSINIIFIQTYNHKR
jgi:heparanase 1